MKMREDVTYNSTSIVTALIPVQTTFDRSKVVLVLERVFKRVVDIIGGICGLILLIPLTIGIYIANLVVGDKGPIFFTQERYGKNGKIFKMYKYRSMVIGADEKLRQYLKNNEEAREEYKKYKIFINDTRITKIGKFTRTTSLYEFPQFINVLKGEMSLVGPRPYLPREKEEINGYFNYITSLKPGITGFWQTNGRNNTTFVDRLDMDMKYYYKHSWKLDMKILKQTLDNVVKKEGAI